MSEKLALPTINDYDLITCVEKIIDDYQINKQHITINTFINQTISFNDINLINKLKSEKSLLINTLSMPFQQLSIVFHRNGMDRKSPFNDEIHFNYHNQHQVGYKNLTQDEQFAIISTLIKDLGVYDNSKRISDSFPQLNESLISAHNAILSKLEVTNTNLTTETQEFRIKLDNEFQKKEENLENNFKTKEDELKREKSDLLEEIKTKKEELEKKEKELLVQTNTHERRTLREKMITELTNRQKKFELTEGTRNIRWVVFILVILLAIIFSYFAYITYQNFSILIMDKKPIEDKIFWVLVVKQAIYSLGFISSISFLIRFQNKWFEQHATEEFYLKRFFLDIERASWLVETCLDWKDSKENVMPQQLLESLSKNLFNDSKASPEIILSPADQLASALVGSSSNIKLNVAGNTLEIDPKKLLKADPIENSNKKD